MFVCMLLGQVAGAQDERFYVVNRDNKLVIDYPVKKGETVFSLSRKFHVPPSMITGQNGLSYQSELRTGAVVEIPLGTYNHINEQPAYMNDVRPLYYKVQGRENMSRIVRMTDVPQRKIERWNNLPNNVVKPGQELMIGWVLYDATPVNQPAREAQNVTRSGGDWSTRAANERNDVREVPERPLDRAVQETQTIIVTRPDTEKQVNPDEEQYLSQTMNEQRVITEKGPAVFFAGASGSSKSFYAFHNSARRGAIIKVFNPGTGKSVFVKVIGTIPGTEQYYNSVIGISAAAKKELGVRENKMFCELTYGVL